MSTKCAACKRASINTETEQATQLCEACANALGVIPLPPARRKLAPCRCCSGTTFIRAIPREVAPVPGDKSQQLSSPMGVTFGAQNIGMLVTTIAADPRRVAGILEMYVCRGCGYVEWYCSDPENVPIGPQFMTEVIEPPGGTGPFR